MSLRLYMDHHVREEVTEGLRRRGVDVITAFDDGAHELPDPDLLDRATSLGRVLFTQDRDLLREAARRQATGEPFAGVIFSAQIGVSIGQCINHLEFAAKAGDPQDLADRVEYLPF